MEKELRNCLPAFAKKFLTPSKDKYTEKYVCPFCESGGHDTPNSNSAFGIYVSKADDGVKTYKYHCFSCEASGDIFDLAKQIYSDCKGMPLSFVEETVRSLNLDESDPETEEHTSKREPVRNEFKTEIEKWHKALMDGDNAGAEYLKGRGFDEADFERFMLGYDAARNVVVFPYDIRELSYYSTRCISEKKFWKPGGIQEPLFNESAVRQPKACFICESQIDALSIMKVGGNAIALGGGGINKLLAVADEIKCMFILSFDNDSPGWDFKDNIAKELKTRHLIYIEAEWSKVFAECKDTNDMLTTNEKQFRKDVEANTVKANPLQVRGGIWSGIMTGFRERMIESIPKVPTGFRTFDQNIGGGLPNGLCVIGGISSMGKSAWVLQMSMNIARTGRPVIYNSLEMSRDDVTSRIISSMCYEYCRKNGISTSQAMMYGTMLSDYKNHRKDAQEIALKMCDEFEQTFSHYMILQCNENCKHYGQINADEIARNAWHVKEQYGVSPVIVIDYLQFLDAPDDMVNGQEKQNLDKSISILHNLGDEMKTPVVTIASLNRQNGKSDIDMDSFCGTSRIEYTANLLCGLQPQGFGRPAANHEKMIEDCKQEDKRFVEVKVVKLRGGRAISRTDMSFMSPYNYFVDGEKMPVEQQAKYDKRTTDNDIPD